MQTVAQNTHANKFPLYADYAEAQARADYAADRQRHTPAAAGTLALLPAIAPIPDMLVAAPTLTAEEQTLIARLAARAARITAPIAHRATYHALEGVATYGVVGAATEHHVPAVRARLLQVRPGLVDQVMGG